MSIELTPTASGTDDNRETIANPERGCGALEPGKAYLKADMSPGGTLPAFVEFESPIPFKENRKRSYTRFPGIQFELSVTGAGGMTETDPKGEVWKHLDRMSDDRPTGEHAGEMVEFKSQDLLLSVGKTHYPEVEDFINEARVHGVSKAISVTSGNEPPEINPGRTRLFLIHPNAVEVEREIETTAGEALSSDEILVVEGGDLETTEIQDLGDDVPVTVKRTVLVPGVFGYTYLTRVVYTEDEDGKVPAYIQEYETLDELDVVTTGREIPYSEQEGFNEDGELTGDAEETLEAHYGQPTPEDALRYNGDIQATGQVEPIDLEEQYPEVNFSAEDAKRRARGAVAALEAPTIDKMEKAPYGELAGRGEIEAMRPPEDEDHFRSGDGALAVVSVDDQHYKVMPTHILSTDGEARTATTQIGPYKVVVASPVGGPARTVEVEKTR